MAPTEPDLIALYCSEARDRLERIADLLEDLPDDNEAAVRARRELHALKGSSRMMGMAEIAEVCHRAEGLLEEPSADAVREMVAILDRLTALVEQLLAGSRQPGAGEVPEEAGEGRRAVAGEPLGAELRVRSEVLDEMTDRGARLRVLSVAAGLLVERLHRLARLADRGAREPSPQEALRALALALGQVAVELEAGQRRVQRLASGLLETLLHLQVQPLRPVLLSLARHARELARTLGKEVRVAVDAGDTDLDRRIIEALSEAFLHVVRNAVDHGVESPQERLAAGKSRRGSLRLQASAEGDRVRITVADDGRGIDADAVLTAAVRRGELRPEAAAGLSNEEVLQLLFLPGFSTREEASETSGRGIGLDAVAAAVQGVGGDLKIDSEHGRGTTVSVEVPAARRGERVLVLKAGESAVAYPEAPVRSFRRLDPARVVEEGSRRFVDDGRGTIRLLDLAEILGLARSERGTVISNIIGGVPLAVVVEGVVGQEEVFVRPMPPRAGAPAVFDGIALLANGRPVPVLSPQRLLAHETISDSGPGGRPLGEPVRVLVVDDSTTTRDVLGRTLTESGFAVTAVPSAEEALAVLAAEPFDCLVTDIEMPGIGGLELTRAVRADERWSELPVVVVSTRDLPEDRRAGLEAGADAYLAKQGLEAGELVSVVRELGRS